MSRFPTQPLILSPREFETSADTLRSVLASQSDARVGPAIIPSPETILVEKIIRIIQESYTEPRLSLKMIGRTERRSPRYLGRIFKKHIGLPFRQYLRGVRIARAERLLLSSHDEVKIIAGVVGYNDASHFTEDFRLLKGCTPSMFRDRARCTLA